MARILCYTSPARGHLYPAVPVLLALQRRGHRVSLRTLSAELPRMSALEFRARAVAPAIEAAAHDDWRARSLAGALARAVGTFVTRAGHEIPELRDAIAAEGPELLGTVGHEVVSGGGAFAPQ